MASARKVYLFTKLPRSSILSFLLTSFRYFIRSEFLYLCLSFVHIDVSAFLCAHITFSFWHVSHYLHFIPCCCPCHSQFHWRCFMQIVSVVCVSLSLCTSHIACPSESISLIMLIISLPVDILPFSNHQTCADLMNCCHVSLGI